MRPRPYRIYVCANGWEIRYDGGPPFFSTKKGPMGERLYRYALYGPGGICGLIYGQPDELAIALGWKRPKRRTKDMEIEWKR